MTAGQLSHDQRPLQLLGVNFELKIISQYEPRTSLLASRQSLYESCLASQPKVPNQRPVQYLGRIGNRYRQKSRPRHPIDLQFQLQMEYIPPEIEIHVGAVGPQRHLVLCTENQLRLLAKARTWYVDGTFHVVKRPFTQLWSIHAFVRVNETMKQLPLMFCLMSARRACDYRAVLELVLVKIQAAGLNVRVECVVSDFETALWSAVRHRWIFVCARFTRGKPCGAKCKRWASRQLIIMNRPSTCTAGSCWHYFARLGLR